MAARKKAPASKAVAKWDEELARQAEIAAAMEASSGGGQFFSIQGGQLTWQDNPMPGNEMAVVILDHIFENTFYEDAYDPDNPAPPSCFAFGRNDKEMEPHIIVREADNQMADACDGCEMNEWGSADTGRGKACKTTRRLAMIPAGNFDKNGDFEMIDDPEFYAKAQIGYMKLPVTSINGFASFVKQVAGTLKRPPFGIFTRVYVQPDPKTQYKVFFEPLDSIPDELASVIMERNEEAKTVIDFPYQLPDEEEPAPRKARGRAKTKVKAKTKAKTKTKAKAGARSSRRY